MNDYQFSDAGLKEIGNAADRCGLSERRRVVWFSWCQRSLREDDETSFCILRNVIHGFADIIIEEDEEYPDNVRFRITPKGTARVEDIMRRNRP